MGKFENLVERLGYANVPGALLRKEEGCSPTHRFSPEIRKLFQEQHAGAAVPDAVVCVDQVPLVCIVDADRDQADLAVPEASIRSLCERLWNQNLIRAVLVVRRGQVEAWAVDTPQARREMHTDFVQAASAGWSYNGLVTGEVLRTRDKWFDPKKRVDRVLLDNVLELVKRLKALPGVDADMAREVTAKLIFAAYLEDRDIVTDVWREKNDAGRLLDLLASRDGKAVTHLFECLRDDFNGDFLQAGKRSHTTWPDLPPDALDELRDFLSNTVMRDGQKDLWRYDFSEIPIELIAGIYETFLSAKQVEQDGSDGAKKSLGAYYTPRQLADLVVDMALEGKSPLDQRIFDGACGSGMLLTAAYRRLLREQRAVAEATGRGEDAWGFDARAKLLVDCVFGADVDEDACRLTAFSLYLALLSDLTPRDIEVLRRGGKKLPKLDGNLWSGNIDGDFFSSQSEARNRGRFSLFLSNPPWVEAKSGSPLGNSIKAWANRHTSPPTVPKAQAAAAFALAAANCMGAGGRIALILPTNLFVASSRQHSLFRKELTDRYEVDQLANFSDMRHLIFADADHPFVVLTGRAREEISSREPSAERFEYLTPKSDVALAFGRLAIHGSDRTELPVTALYTEPNQLRSRYWGSQTDLALLGRLKLRGTVQDLLARPGWSANKGIHFKDDDRRRPVETRSTPVPDWMRDLPFLPTRHVDKHLPVVHPATLTKFPTDRIARVPKNAVIFRSPRILWPDGTHPERGVKAVYSDKPFTFQHTLGVVCAPNTPEDRRVAKLLAAYMRSTLGVWAMMLTSSTVASERPKLHIADLKLWPFWMPEDHPDPALAQTALDDLEAVFEGLLNLDIIAAEHAAEDGRDAIDRIIFRYFGLNSREQELVLEMARVAAPSIQPQRLTSAQLLKPFRLPSSNEAIHAYCERLESEMRDWRDATGGEGDVNVVPWTAHSVPLGAAVVSLRGADEAAPAAVSGDGLLQIIESTLTDAVGESCTAELLSMPDLMIISDERIYLVKPLTSRFWLQRSAVEDARRIAQDMQAHLEGGGASLP